MLQEFDDFHQLFFGFVDAGHVAEAHLHVVLGVDLRLAARERHDAAFSAAHLPEEEAPEGNEKEQWNNPAQEFWQPAVHQLAAVLDAALLELGDERGVSMRVVAKASGFPVRIVGFERAANDLLADSSFSNLALHDSDLNSL